MIDANLRLATSFFYCCEVLQSVAKHVTIGLHVQLHEMMIVCFSQLRHICGKTHFQPQYNLIFHIQYTECIANDDYVGEKQLVGLL